MRVLCACMYVAMLHELSGCLRCSGDMAQHPRVSGMSETKCVCGWVDMGVRVGVSWWVGVCVCLCLCLRMVLCIMGVAMWCIVRLCGQLHMPSFLAI